MQHFSHRQAIDDLKNLKSLTLGYAFLNGTYNTIHDAYSDYLKSLGSPHLKAIGLSKDQKTCLHAAYEGGAKKYGLDWIPKIRDVLIGSCPMCGNSAVGTVEHYLPKAPFPEFSVFSWNLVPSCNSCNQKRGSRHTNGVKHKLLHPIFDENIFNRLKLVTHFDVSGAVTEFEVGFNELDFDPVEQTRIHAHIMTCIDRRAFKLATNVQISTMAARVARKKEAVWGTIIEEELAIMHAANLGYGWGASCLRGLLEVNQTQRSAILIPKLL
ncbi:hypothetical protein K0P33_13190 [Pseudomonas sp. ArH3a]|uniref:HNH endonuclease n=1 Tax=Pseudomonas sp. ArH3a TaxID=2862945 RepID=UPI001F594E20|nr:hypothetical protein [Pseudomonas sp. ArH3a]UNM22340.1 hypothetical protein K0P33_13190 [Pseudomonas sp. ArH3a]